MALETWFAMLPKLVVSDGAICSRCYLLGGQAVNMFSLIQQELRRIPT